MTDFKEGNVVIVGTGQAGTIVGYVGRDVSVLLTNGNMWHGSDSQCRLPQDQADLDAAPLEVDRFKDR